MRGMQEYCMAKDDLEYIIDVTKFKTKAPWGGDPYKDVAPQVKAAFTRCSWLLTPASA